MTTWRCTEKQTTRAQLEQEYVFMGVISTFLRAIRAGAIYPTHSAVLLTHHGHLGVAFDHCSKIVVDVLREEGMYKGHGDVVVDVVTIALKDVSKAKRLLMFNQLTLPKVVHLDTRRCRT